MDKADTPKIAKPKQRRFAVRWSLRMLVIPLAMLAALLAVMAHWMRVGQTHQQVADALTTELGVARVTWERETVELVSLDNSATTALSGATRSNYRRVVVKDTPPWMHRTGTEFMFHRIRNIHLNHSLDSEQIDSVISHLKRLDHIETLHLNGNRLTANQFSDVVAHAQVDFIYAYGIEMKPQERIPGLSQNSPRVLVISHTWFSDAAIADLPTSLERLELTRTAVTDQGLDGLVRLKNLDYLSLRRTPTTQAAIERLRRKMPWCEIAWEPIPSPED